MTATVRVLLVTKGHPFEREPFLAMFDALADASPSIVSEHVEHPEAQQRLHPDRLGDIDAVVFYDMPGLRFTRADPPVELVAPHPSITRCAPASRRRSRCATSCTWHPC